MSRGHAPQNLQIAWHVPPYTNASVSYLLMGRSTGRVQYFAWLMARILGLLGEQAGGARGTSANAIDGCVAGEKYPHQSTCGGPLRLRPSVTRLYAAHIRGLIGKGAVLDWAMPTAIDDCSEEALSHCSKAARTRAGSMRGGGLGMVNGFIDNDGWAAWPVATPTCTTCGRSFLGSVYESPHDSFASHVRATGRPVIGAQTLLTTA